MVFCPNCGKELGKEDKNFCTNCGSGVNKPKKKILSDTATAIFSALVLSCALAFFFLYAVKLDVVFSIVLALLFFIGLSIVFYNFLKTP